MALENAAPVLGEERIDWSATQDQSESLSDAEIDERYVRGEVRIVTEQGALPVDEISSLVHGEKYELNPDFQRRRRWPVEKQSRLVESLIMNVPVPPIFLYEDSYNHFQVMDGLQRMSALADFYDDQFALTDLDEWSDLNGRTYSRLPEQVRRGIDRRKLPTITLLRETATDPREAERLKQVVFERINSGGIDLSAQETRNALYPGPMNTLCERLSRNPSFCRTWNLPEPDEAELVFGTLSDELLADETYRRMDDVEMVLRFFAHRQRTRLLKSGRLDRYLDSYLKAANLFPSAVLDFLETLFGETIALVYGVLGESAFHLWRNRRGSFSWVQRPTVVAYDPIMSAFSKLLNESDSLISSRTRIREDLPKFYEQSASLFDGRKTNATDVDRRDEAFLSFLASYI